MDSIDSVEDDLIDLSPLQGAATTVNAHIQELLALFDASLSSQEENHDNNDNNNNNISRKAKEFKEKVDATKDKLVQSIKSRQKQAKRKFQEKSVEFRVNVKKQLRSVFTGDPNRSFRRHIQEPPQIKFIDKACFTVSIIHILLTEMFFIKFQQYFVNYYAGMLVLLMLTRYIDYKSKKYHYFLLDFCYFVNFLALIHGYICPNNDMFFRSLFVLANGPVLIAIIVWRNSMVFHSVDKMTSLFIHVFPPLYTYIQHWELTNTNNIDHTDTNIHNTYKTYNLSLTDWLIYPTILYLLWQFSYLIKTEFIDADFLKSNPNIATSLRWLSSDDKNFLNKLAIKYCRKLGILSNNEKFDSSQWKTKFIFMFLNFLYYLFTILFVKFSYDYKYFHLFFMFITLLSSIFNGANYYIEIFSERYNESLKMKQLKVNEKYLTIEERLDEILKKKFQEIEKQFDDNGGGSSDNSKTTENNTNEMGNDSDTATAEDG